MKHRVGFAVIAVVFFSLLFAYVQCADAYWEDQNEDTATAVFSGAGQNGQSTLAFSYRQPIPSGWFGVYTARATHEGEVLSEVYAGHLQGGFDIGEFGVEAYGTAKRDLLQAIKLGIEFGYFGRPPGFRWGAIDFNSGFGNFSARNDNDEEIGRDAADTTTTFGWLAFLTARLKTQLGEASVTGRYKPSIDLKDTRIEVLGALNKEISDTWQFGVSTLTEFNSASIVEDDLHTSYLLTFTFTPEN